MSDGGWRVSSVLDSCFTDSCRVPCSVSLSPFFSSFKNPFLTTAEHLLNTLRFRHTAPGPLSRARKAIREVEDHLMPGARALGHATDSYKKEVSSRLALLASGGCWPSLVIINSQRYHIALCLHPNTVFPLSVCFFMQASSICKAMSFVGSEAHLTSTKYIF